MTLNAFTLHIFQPYSTLLLAIVTMLLVYGVYTYTMCAGHHLEGSERYMEQNLRIRRAQIIR